MARLIDRINAQNLHSHIENWLRESMILDATNVGEYYYANYDDKNHWNIATDFPNVAPPWSDFFVEFTVSPQMVASPKKAQYLWYPATNLDIVNAPYAWGLLCGAEPIRPDNEITLTSRVLNADGESEELVRLPLVSGSWVLHIVLIIEQRKHGEPEFVWRWDIPVAPTGSIYTHVDARGVNSAIIRNTPLERAYKRWEMLDHYDGSENPRMPLRLDHPRYDEIMADAQSLYHDLSAIFEHRYLGPLLLALSFAHCKNVTVIQERPPDWQQKAALKKHKRPLVTYHVLNIEPMKTVIRTEGDIEHNGLPKALHICRGHFKTYTPEHPLFGRVTGTYWWAAHVRGSKEEGLALKDYNVIAPRPLRETTPPKA